MRTLTCAIGLWLWKICFVVGSREACNLRLPQGFIVSHNSWSYFLSNFLLTNLFEYGFAIRTCGGASIITSFTKSSIFWCCFPASAYKQACLRSAYRKRSFKERQPVKVSPFTFGVGSHLLGGLCLSCRLLMPWPSPFRSSQLWALSLQQ